MKLGCLWRIKKPAKSKIVIQDVEPFLETHTTFVAVYERDGKFLLVKEKIGSKIVCNQPAGYLETNESLLDAVAREKLEETLYSFTLKVLLSIYLLVA